MLSVPLFLIELFWVVSDDCGFICAFLMHVLVLICFVYIVRSHSFYELVIQVVLSVFS